MTYGTHMNDLDSISTQVWSTPDVKDKRNLLRRAVATFKYKNKRQEFLDQIEKADANKCDFMASNLALNKHCKVVSLLPR